MKNQISLFLVVIIIITNQGSSYRVHEFPMHVEVFDFTLTNGNVVNLADYQDKPIVIDWTASWCGICEENLRVIRSLYDEFKDYANFITLGYSRSGDDLDKVQQIQNSKRNDWTFGFDHTDYADVADAGNADIWIMDTQLKIVYSWNEAIITKSDFSMKLQNVIGEITSVITSEEKIITSTISFDTEDEISTFGLFSNPFFVGFVVFSSLIGLIVIFFKIRN